MSPRAPQSVVSSPRAQASTASTVRSPERAPLAQHYGFKPGTYMIGQFGTTAEARASMVPNDNPGPGAYDPAVTALGHPRGMSPRVGSLDVVHHSDTSWGSDPIPSNRVAAVRDRTPAPGVHGAEVPSDGTILLNSCSDTGAIGAVAGNVTLNLNHIRLTWDSTAVSQIQTWLN